jgi:hypothetical protein
MEIEKYTNQQKQIIKDIHMEKRCWVIFAMCSLSLYNWYHYSLFETPFINHISKPYYWNYLIFIGYLLWDNYKMLFSEHKTILYRTDLLIHHFVSLSLFCSLIKYTSLLGSGILIMECISLMNYLWSFEIPTGNTTNYVVNDVAIDANNNILITGGFGNSISLNELSPPIADFNFNN